MKKLIAYGSVALLLPGLAFAQAYNDVSLDTNVVLSVGGITVNVTGATISQIAVGASTFDLTLGPGSTMTVNAPNRNQMTYSSTAFLTANECSGSSSSFTMTAAATDATTTVTVTPSSTICADSNSSSSTSSSGGGGGAPVGLLSGGGSGTTTIIPTTPTPTPAPAAASSAQAQQVLALVAQLKSLIAIYESLGGVVSPEMRAVLNAFPASSSFARNLEVGSTGDDVKALQMYLNTHGYAVASSGPGSPGQETMKFGNATKAALAKLQQAAGISPAAGYFGSKTRAYVNAHP